MHIASHPKDERTILVLYGSQTGNAESVAADVARELFRRHIKCVKCPLNDAADFALLGDYDDTECESTRPPTVAVFITSTTGQGLIPTNASKFWLRLLRADLPRNKFAHLKFTVFGLGDSRYSQFNHAALKLHKRLRQLSAVDFYRLGLGDDQHDFGYEGELDPWLAGMLEAADKLFPLPAGESLRPDGELPRPKYIVNVLSNHPDPPTTAAAAWDVKSSYFATRMDDGGRPLNPRKLNGSDKFDHPSASRSSPSFESFASVECNTRMTAAGHFQDVRRLKVSLSPQLSKLQSSLPPGASLSIYPVVQSHKAYRFLRSINLHPSTLLRITLSPNGEQLKSPFTQCGGVLTLFEVVSYFLDIMRVPDRFFFRYLSHFATDQEEREKLAEIGGRTPESKDYYYEYCKLEKRNYADIFWDFPSAQPPLDHLLSMLPEIEPRKYSIASDAYWYEKSFWWPLGVDQIRASAFLAFRAAPFVGLWRCQFPQSEDSAFLRLVDSADSKYRKLVTSRHTLDIDSTENHQHIDQAVACKPYFQSVTCRLLRWVLSTAKSLLFNSAVAAAASATPYCPTGGVETHTRGALDLCIALVEYKTKLQREIVGLCSSYIRDLQPGDWVAVSLEDCTPAAPLPDVDNLDTPLVMICPGTGVSPCRAIVQRRYRRILDLCRESPARYASWLQHKATTPDLLILGFRYRNSDYLFAEEWETYTKCPSPSLFDSTKKTEYSSRNPALLPPSTSGQEPSFLHNSVASDTAWSSNESADRSKATAAGLDDATDTPTGGSCVWLNVYTAFSRDDINKKVYVQDLIEEHGKQVYSALQAGASVIICGSSHPMPSQVDDALRAVVKEQQGSFTTADAADDAADRYLKALKREKRHVCDTWG